MCVCGQSIILQTAHPMYSLNIVHWHRTLDGCHQFEVDFFHQNVLCVLECKYKTLLQRHETLHLFTFLNLTITLPGKIIFTSFGMAISGKAGKLGYVGLTLQLGQMFFCMPLLRYSYKTDQQRPIYSDAGNLLFFVNLCEMAVNPYPTAFPYGNGMVLHFYQQQESSTTKTVHKVINKGLKTYV